MIDRRFEFKKVQIENFVKAEFTKKFKRNSRISLRKRQKFISEVTRKIGKKFGKDVLCLVDFTRRGFVSLVSPSHIESTDKGKLFQSFSHPQIYYTSHCIDRFSERTDTAENCIVALDLLMNDALLTFGEQEGYLTCPQGVFACDFESGRMIIKTYIHFDMLSEEQIRTFYGPGTVTVLSEDILAEDDSEADFILADEYTHSNDKPTN